MNNKSDKKLTSDTLEFYEGITNQFWIDTQNHDVSQNYANFLENINYPSPLNILDLGCGPGRDSKYFKELGHTVHGLDGSISFCHLAKEYSGAEILHQNFIELNLKENFYHGVFANASLLHVPRTSLLKVLKDLNNALRTEGILFSSNLRGNQEYLKEKKFVNLMDLEIYKTYFTEAGFKLIHHYYRPEHLPLEERPWLATVLKKI